MLLTVSKIVAATIAVSIAVQASVVPRKEADVANVTGASIRKNNWEGGPIRRCIDPDMLALTFDDGPFLYTSELLDYLDDQGVKVTLFMNGDSASYIEDHEDIVRRAYRSGHQIGSHTWSHADLTTLSEADIDYQMVRLDESFKKIIGVRPVHMRPPYGNVNERSMNYLNRHGYKVINWSIDSNDWRYRDNVHASLNEYYVALARSDAGGLGHIVIHHDTIPSTVRKLVPLVIDFAREKGFRLVTVGECLGESQSKWYR
ncbi:hypothetical protein BX616_003388 [Lobosporangium transversale]|uniref:Polysaccharide deacetylase n=1 Tax=Lobosporangium transversale TaxID=64571 RepID=A0A1Y2G8V0_9FUNG|nr:polysaccharide deacetylase [Lobosporangium transversale]KAF9898989.1 hypothetical protein BX616_003388 [Lobosporangium transversale]ORZ04423.1 polysaccharide deacetylase [Lobosporangium transversale]|eukprot:XP_021876531.1 polysaccharide deacetylase [Lobosporangium transversale]